MKSQTTQRHAHSYKFARASLWLPHPLVALEAMKLVFKLPAMPNLSLCAVRYSKSNYQMSAHVGKDHHKPHTKTANQTFYDSQWKNTASYEKQSCPQIKPEPDQSLEIQLLFCRHWRPEHMCNPHWGYSQPKLRCGRLYRINSLVSSTNNLQERDKRKT